MKFKKTLSALLAAVSLLGLAAGCGCSKQKDELVWYIPGATLDDKAAVEAKINEIVEPKIGRKVRLETIDSASYGQQMGMMLSAGDDSFDLYFAGYLIGYDKCVDDEVLAPMTELISNNAPELWDAIPEYAWEDMKHDGEIYAVPNVQIMATQYSYGIQTEVFDKFVADQPDAAKKLGWIDENGEKTGEYRINQPEDLEPVLAYVKANYPDKYAYRPNYGTTMWTLTKYEDIGAGMSVPADGDSKEVVVSAQLPEYKQAAETLRSWFEKGYIRADIATVADDNAEFNAGRYAVNQFTWKPSTSEQYPPEDWTFVLIGDAFVPRGAAKSTATGINYMSPNKEDSIKLLSLVQTDSDLYNLLTLGIEGQHYNLNEDGTYTPVEDSGYGVTQWMVGNQFHALVKEGSSPTVWEETDAMNNDSVKTKLSGFNFDTTMVASQVSAISADSTVYATNASRGTKPVGDYWNDYMSLLENKGVNDIKAEAQAQLDAFWAAKEAE